MSPTPREQVAHVLHEPPFTLKVLGNVVVVGWKDLLDRDIDAEIRPCDRGERATAVARQYEYLCRHFRRSQLPAFSSHP